MPPINKRRRQQAWIQKKQGTALREREERFRRRRQESDNPQLREERLARNKPTTLEDKRTWQPLHALDTTAPKPEASEFDSTSESDDHNSWWQGQNTNNSADDKASCPLVQYSCFLTFPTSPILSDGCLPKTATFCSRSLTTKLKFTSSKPSRSKGDSNYTLVLFAHSMFPLMHTSSSSLPDYPLPSHCSPTLILLQANLASPPQSHYRYENTTHHRGEHSPEARSIPS